jgi:hypothetical protein
MTNLFRQSKNPTQKLKYILGGVVVSIILMGYQNCGKVSMDPSSQDTAQEQKPALMDLDGVNNITLLKANENLDMVSYDVEISTGHVVGRLYDVPANDPANVASHLCLSDAKRAELEDALKKASVCYFKASSEHLSCTLEYKYPYAVVKDNSGNSYRVGENAKICFDHFDICLDHKDELLAAIQDILADIDTASCN